MPEPTFTLFLDESGDDTLYSDEEYASNSRLETHCTLVGVVVANNKKEGLKKALCKLKNDIWGADDVVLHSVKIRNKVGAFVVFSYNPDLYEYFQSGMNQIIEEISPIIFCSSLNKRLWINKYPRKLHFRDDPYSQAFVYLLERYAHFLDKQDGDNPRGKIVVEKRNARQNGILKDEYTNFLEHGTQYYQLQKTPYNKLAANIEFKRKDMNIPGLQIADYLCYPFYKNHKMPGSENKHYEFLEKFVYPGDRGRYGHKKWPV